MTASPDQPHGRRTVRHSEQAEVDAPVRPATARTGRRAQLPSATEWRADDAAAPTWTDNVSHPVNAVHATLTPVGHGHPVTGPLASVDSDRENSARGRRASLPAGEVSPAVLVELLEPAVEVLSTEEPGAVVVAPERAEPVDAPVIFDAPSAPEDVAVTAPPPGSFGLTRRELRERRVAAEKARAQETPEAIGAILNSGPILLPYLSSAPTQSVADALAEFDALTREPHAVASVDSGEANLSIAAPISAWGLQGHAVTEPEPQSGLEPERLSNTGTELQAELEPETELKPETEQKPETELEAELEAEFATDDDDEPIIFIDPTPTPTSLRSSGHWSVRAEMDDDIEFLEGNIARSVGADGEIVTNAFVMPATPYSVDITSPFTASGEAMITGTVDLPASLASTGAQPGRVDQSDYDMDPLDREVSSTDSAPVRAIRAVSTHTSSNGMITGRKPQGNRMLTILVVSASGMAVAVAGLLFAGFALNVFP